MRRPKKLQRQLVTHAAVVATLGMYADLHAALTIDVRLSNGQKSGFVTPGDDVSIDIFLVGGDTGLANGLGGFNVSVRSSNESPAVSGLVFATGSTNETDASVLDFARSSGTLADCTIAADTDNDLDVLSITGTQNTLNGWDPNYGKTGEIRLGTATFKASPTNSGTVSLNAYFNGSGGTLGGAVIRTLTGSGTSTNSVSATNLLTASSIGTPVTLSTVLDPPPPLVWTGGTGGTGTQWLDASNWYDNQLATHHVPASTEKASFTVGSDRTVGIDFSASTNNGPANQAVGQIQHHYWSTGNVNIINSSTIPGTLTLTSSTLLNSLAAGYKLTIGGSGGPMTVALQNSGAIDVTYDLGTIEIAVPISGAGKSITKQGAGKLILSAVNTYDGASIVQASSLTQGLSTLQITTTGSIASPSVSVDDRAVLIVDGAMAASAVLTSHGTSTFNSASQAIASLAGNSTGKVILNGTALCVGSGSFSGVISGTGSLAKNTAGTLTLYGANTYSGATKVTDGSLILANSLLGSTSVSVDNSKLQSASDGNRMLKTPTVSITNGGQVDLTNNKMIVPAGNIGTWNGSDYDGLTGLVKAGRNGGAWNGSGIVTSMTAAGDTSGLTTLAIATASEAGKSTFGTVPVTGTDVLIMYTYAGDANLSGRISGDDYFQIDAGFSGHATGYFNGDFDYSGTIDADDYFIIDRNYVRQTTTYANAPPAGLSVVPEPGTMWLVACGLGMSLGRRRWRRDTRISG